MSEEEKNLEEKDMVEEIWKHRDDPEEWGEEATDIKARPSRSSVVSFRLPIEELDAVEEAAERNGESVSQYIRGALALRLHEETAGSPAAIMYGSWGIPDEDPDQLMVNSTIFMGAFTKAYRSKASILGGYGPWQPLQQRLALR